METLLLAGMAVPLQPRLEEEEEEGWAVMAATAAMREQLVVVVAAGEFLDMEAMGAQVAEEEEEVQRTVPTRSALPVVLAPAEAEMVGTMQLPALQEALTEEEEEEVKVPMAATAARSEAPVEVEEVTQGGQVDTVVGAQVPVPEE